MSFDRNRRQLGIGDRIIWFTIGRLIYTGKVIGLQNSVRSHFGQVRINWDHRSNDDTGWHDANLLIKLSEEDIREFFEESGSSTDLGEIFCNKFKFEDEELRRLRCPGKARHRIIERYGMNI